MALTDTFTKNAKHKRKCRWRKAHATVKGMYLLRQCVGKYWRMAYRYMQTSSKTLALGVYPAGYTLARGQTAHATRLRELLATVSTPAHCQT
jgi:hypothetical protein